MSVPSGLVRGIKIHTGQCKAPTVKALWGSVRRVRGNFNTLTHARARVGYLKGWWCGCCNSLMTLFFTGQTGQGIEVVEMVNKIVSGQRRRSPDKPGQTGRVVAGRA
jgi:predicted metal-binding membrane protein